MANKAKDQNVTRITASDSGATKRPKTKSSDTKTVTKTKAVKTSQRDVANSDRRGPLQAFLGYFTGAWYELRQVRWPTRGATWSLTGAVLAFSAFFIVFILLIDAGFKFIFELLLK